MTLHHGDCLEVMAGLEPESVDAIVTDPPYGLEFMGKAWDKLGATSGSLSRQKLPLPHFRATGISVQEWHSRWAEAAFRVAKPSSYLLAFGGTRTVHRMTVAIEDAGWIIRDMLVWAYASGFPKSKASLKPAWEPIVMARKPGPLRMLAIDECRIGPPLTEAEIARTGGVMGEPDGRGIYGPGKRRPAGAARRTSSTGLITYESAAAGRWPANVILTDPIFDGGWDGVVGGGETTSGSRNGQYAGSASWSGEYGRDIDGDSGTYSRFFVLPKADRADREPVLGGLATKRRTMGAGLTGVSGDRSGRGGNTTPLEMGAADRANVHPTVKPVDLMRHLVRLVTPTGGTVLDPFLGSGTTAIAAEMEGFDWIGIEKEAEYVAIAEARLNGTQRGLGLPA